MKSKFIAACIAVAALALLGGCTTDQYARMLIKHDTSYGKFNEAVVGSSEQLVRSEKISAARRYTMPDGVEIDVWVRKADTRPPARGTVLILHGLCDSKVTFMRLARKLTEKGFDVVLPDFRAHGRSTGRYVTYGALEKHDQRRVMDELLKEKLVGEPLYVFGASMGANVAIQYAALEPRVRGVMAMAPARDMRSVCRRFIRRVAPLMSDEDFEKVFARAGEIGGFDPAEASAIDDVAKLRCPVLLVHGKLDSIVPSADSEALYAAAPGPKELELDGLSGHLGIPLGWEGRIVEAMERLAAGQVGTTAQPAEGE